MALPFIYKLNSDDDVVDGDVDQLDKESDESHDGETNDCGKSNFLEFLSVGLCAFGHKTGTVLSELDKGDCGLLKDFHCFF